MASGMATANANGLLLLLFNATTFANVAINATSSPQTNMGISLHTSSPGTGGTAATNEMQTSGSSGYNGYQRINVPRTSATPGWLVTSNAVSPTAAMSFPVGTGGSGVATDFAVAQSNATPPTGTQLLYYYGTVTPSITCGNTITPSLTTASTITMV